LPKRECKRKIRMASKPNKMNKTMRLLYLLALFASVLFSSCSSGFQKNLELKNGGHFGEDLGEYNIHVDNLAMLFYF